MWRVCRKSDRRTDGRTNRRTTEDRQSERLTWSLGSGALKTKPGFHLNSKRQLWWTIFSVKSVWTFPSYYRTSRPHWWALFCVSPSATASWRKTYCSWNKHNGTHISWFIGVECFTSYQQYQPHNTDTAQSTNKSIDWLLQYINMYQYKVMAMHCLHMKVKLIQNDFVW